MKKFVLITCLLSALTACTTGQQQASGSTQRVTQEQMREILREQERAPRPTTATTCGAGACYCEGVKACMDLIDSGQCKRGFHCGGGTPVCVCEK